MVYACKLLWYCLCKKRNNQVETSRVPLLFHFHVPSQYGGDFTLHERPGHVGTRQRAFLPTGAVHLPRGALLFDALAGAWEAELVRWNGRALNEMRVLQALVTQGAAQRHAAWRHGGVRNALRVPRLRVHAWHMHGRCAGAAGRPQTVPLGKPPLPRRLGAAAVPATAAGGGVYLVFGGSGAGTVRRQNEGGHRRRTVLHGGGRLRWSGARMGRDGGGGSSGESRQGHGGNLQHFRRQPLLTLAVHLGRGALAVWLGRRFPFNAPRVFTAVCRGRKTDTPVRKGKLD